ncbi:hypothetical protein BGZ96_002449 [Linnemannia gamsii]|uniref:Uncharacterized protein n=1 Tax=Linnemannia gamsii TaxID=64522 RepID=A0ABQ7JKK5_9FUNG|nr:hypothetical protein BGZ96_002449 [Linnemannia gamsii]
MFKNPLCRAFHFCAVAVLVLFALVATTPELTSAATCSKYFETCGDGTGLTCCSGLSCKSDFYIGYYCDKDKNSEPKPEPEPQPPSQPQCKQHGQFCKKDECCPGVICSKRFLNPNTPFKCRPQLFAGVRAKN